jgi:uncharacterized RDD family membrane protein YckC
VATLIDVVILLAITVPLLLAIYGREYLARSPEEGFAGFWDFMLQVVLPAIAVIVLWKVRGATPGKMAISAKIVDARTGAAPATGKLVLRYFAYILSILPLGLGFAWVAIDRRKQGFHDKIAGTLVVYEHD